MDGFRGPKALVKGFHIPWCPAAVVASKARMFSLQLSVCIQIRRQKGSCLKWASDLAML